MHLNVTSSVASYPAIITLAAADFYDVVCCSYIKLFNVNEEQVFIAELWKYTRSTPKCVSLV